MRKKYVYFLFSIFYFFSSGCGYTTRGFTYKEQKIYIAPVTNAVDITSEDRKYSSYKSYPLLVEKRVTNSLVNKFNIDGRLCVVSEPGPNTLQLICKIQDYYKEALKYTENDEVREQRIRLSVHMKLVGTEAEVFQEKDVIGRASYFLSGAQSKSESAAQEELIDDACRRILEAVTEQW